MIYAYGVTLQGTYHVKNNMVCQDAHSIIKIDDRIAVAAVADGLGSEDYSDVASRLAADISSKYCAEHISALSTDEEIIEAIDSSFHIALSTIEQTANDNGNELDQYDTTLSLVVMHEGSLFYGHSGDSGIVALNTDGLYCKVTEQQRDSHGCVFPLFFKDKWVFEKYDKKVASVFLATDGMLETLFPIYIRNEEVNIYVALADFFMNPKKLQLDENGEEAVQDYMTTFIEGIPDAQVNDDKTVVVLVDTDVEFQYQQESYYAEPDWAALKEKYEEDWKRAAYPHLYKETEESPVNDNDNVGDDIEFEVLFDTEKEE